MNPSFSSEDRSMLRCYIKEWRREAIVTALNTTAVAPSSSFSFARWAADECPQAERAIWMLSHWHVTLALCTGHF
jgi:hypothetical protein